MIVYLCMETFDKMLLENKDGVEFRHSGEKEMLKMVPMIYLFSLITHLITIFKNQMG